MCTHKNHYISLKINKYITAVGFLSLSIAGRCMTVQTGDGTENVNS